VDPRAKTNTDERFELKTAERARNRRRVVVGAQKRPSAFTPSSRTRGIASGPGGGARGRHGVQLLRRRSQLEAGLTPLQVRAPASAARRRISPQRVLPSRAQLSVWLGKKQMFRYLFRMYVTQKWQALLITLSSRSWPRRARSEPTQPSCRTADVRPRRRSGRVSPSCRSI